MIFLPKNNLRVYRMSKNEKPNLNKNEILNELTKRQLLDVDVNNRLKYKDLCRIVSKINKSIFTNECCLWEGYVTNLLNPKKGRYVNFYFNKKKTPLHRLIYNNFKGCLEKGEYLKFLCKNKGYCLNINHIEKVYNDKPNLYRKKTNIKLPDSTKVTFE